MSIKEPDSPSHTIQKWVNECFDKLLSQDHVATMKRCGVVYLSGQGSAAGRYIVNVLKKTYTVELDARKVVDVTTGREASEKLAYVLLEYLLGEGGASVLENWQPVENITSQPSYRYYYQKAVVRPLERLFGYNRESFESVSMSLGGKKEKLGGIAYSFQFLPKVSALIQIWVGNTEEMIKPRINTYFNAGARLFLKDLPLLYVFEILSNFMERAAKKGIKS